MRSDADTLRAIADAIHREEGGEIAACRELRRIAGKLERRCLCGAITWWGRVVHERFCPRYERPL